MTWDEYKKKNNVKQNNVVSNQRQIAPINRNIKNKTTSSWDEYKKKNNVKPNKLSPEYQKIDSNVSNNQKLIAPINSMTDKIKQIATSNEVQAIAQNLKEQNENKIKESTGKYIIGKANNVEDNYMVSDYYNRNNQNVKNTQVLIDKEGNIYDAIKLSREEKEELEKLEGTKTGQAEIDNGELIRFINYSKGKSIEGQGNLQDFAKEVGKDVLLAPARVKAPNITYMAESEAKGTTDAVKAMEIWARSHMASTQEQWGFDEVAEKNREKIKDLNNDIQTPVMKSSSVNKAGEVGGQVFHTIGNMMPSMLASVIPGGGIASSVLMGTNVAGQDIGEGIAEGESFKQANLGGDLKGLASIAIEKGVGGVKIGTKQGKGLLDDVVGNVIADKTKHNITNFLATKGYQIFGEVAEENIENVAGYAIDALIDNKELPSFKEMWNDAVETSKSTALTTLTLNIMGFGGNNLSTYTELENITGKKLTDKQKQAVDKVIEDTRNEIIKNDAQEASKTGKNIQEQQTILNNNETAQNTTQLDDIMNNKGFSMQSYQYEKSDNILVNVLRQDASKYFNNSEKTQNYMRMLEQIITDKGIGIRLDSNLKTADGKVANGSYANGIITINPNSTRAGEFIAIHELTHAIGTEQMRNIVEKYRTSNIEFDTELQNILQNYNTTELTDEAMSDVAGQLFGNQEFINNIKQNNPNIFQKIYSEIKYLWHQFRGYKSQDQFVDDLYYKWTKAYNSNRKLNETANFSVGGIEGLENISNINEKNEGYRRYKEAMKMVREKANNQEIFEKTGWFQDKITGKMKFNFSDKDMDIINKNYVVGKEYKLKDILKHDTLFEMYPQLENYTVIIEDMNSNKKDKTIRGSYNRYSDTIKLDYRRFNNKVDVEGTLIHEIQHAIQKIEKFSRGTSKIWGEKFYKKSPGEIEARDTTQRLIEEKYNGKDLRNVMPQSGDIELSVLDKMKNGLYNYLSNLKSGVDSDETISKIQDKGTQDNIKDNGLVLGGISERIQESENNSGSFSMQDNKGRKLTNEQQEYFKNSKVRDSSGNLLEVYHGTPYEFYTFNYDRLGENTSSLGAGFYFSDQEQTGKEYTRDNGELKRVYLDIEKPMSYGKTTISKSEYEKFIKAIDKETNGNYLLDYDGIDNALMEYEYGGDDIDLVNAVKNSSGLTWEKTFEILRDSTGFDGIISDKGFLNEGETIYVAFNPNQIKNVDNNTPTINADTRYSKDNKNWQSYLEKNFKATGTRTNLEDIKLKSKEIAPPAKNIKTESKVEEFNRYKKNLIKANEKTINDMIFYKNESMRNIDSKILEKQKLLNSKQNKDTKTVAMIRSQIENLKAQKTKIENLYNEKIDKFNSKISKEKIELEVRNTLKKEARNNLKAEIEPLIQDLTKYKDKKNGLRYNRETAQRNIDDIVIDKDLATAIKETVFDPVQVHQAEKTREANALFEKINSLDLDKKKKYYYVPKGEIVGIKIDEATLAQLIIEKQINDTDLRNYGIDDAGIKKIHTTADTFTEILDYLYDRMNEEQIKYGYSPIGRIENYFPHLFENKPDKMLSKIASYFGIDLTKQELPTEIAGKTDTFKPGEVWNSNLKKRRTNKTDYDALTAMQNYINGACEIIYTTEDIQRVREYSKQIRYKFSDEGMKTEIDKIINNTELTQEAKDLSLEGIFGNTKNELSNFVTWLDDYANTLAGKKAFSDRSIEHNIGRNVYSSMSGIESRIAANTIGGNLSVSFTNFAPIFQAAGTTKWNYLITGMLQTAQKDVTGLVTKSNDISFVSNSNFLTNRFGTDTIAKKKTTQKISDVLSIPMNAIDEFTSESIVRAKYLENLDKGMSEEIALDKADKYAAKLMADRSKGALPLIFNAKNPLSKLATMFQVEPNNIVSNYLKDMPREAGSKKQLTIQATKLMVASYAFNTVMMGIRGRKRSASRPNKMGILFN